MRLIAYILIALATALSCYLAEDQWLWIPVGILVGASFLPALRFEYTPARLSAMGLAAFVLSIVWFMLAPFAPTRNGFYPSEEFFRVVYLWCLFFMAGQLLFRPMANPVRIRGRGQWYYGLREGYPLYGLVVIGLSGDQYALDPTHRIMQIGMALYVLLTLFYWMRIRIAPTQKAPFVLKRQQLWITVAIVLGIGLGLLGSELMWRQMHNLERVVVFLARKANLTPEQTGFSGRARLGSVADMKEADGLEVALRVESAATPGYLRGAAFDYLDGDRWANTVSKRPLVPEDTEDASLLWYIVDATVEREPDPMTIWAEDMPVDTLFTPEGVGSIGVEAKVVEKDAHGLCIPQSRNKRIPYQVHHGRPTRLPDLSADLEKRLLQVPSDLDSQVKALAARITVGAKHDEERIARVVQHFQKNYTYTLGIEIPFQEDPLTYFLLEQPDAHCEYFAAGAAILLRLAGVPCRYVTGFVAMEQHPSADYWLARNRDAHAWVEAYTEDQGWVIVEATPASGIPQGDAPPDSSYAMDNLIHQWKRLVAAILQGPAGWPRYAVYGVGGLVLLMGLGITGWLLYRLRLLVRKVSWGQGRTDEFENPDLKTLHRLLKEKLTQLKGKGLQRKDSETLLQFADRIDAHSTSEENLSTWSDWLRRYVAVRYRPQGWEKGQRELVD